MDNDIIKNNVAVNETYRMCEWHSKSDVMPILQDLHWQLSQAHEKQKRLEDIINEQTRFQRFSKYMQENWKWIGGLGSAVSVTATLIYKIITYTC